MLGTRCGLRCGLTAAGGSCFDLGVALISKLAMRRCQNFLAASSTAVQIRLNFVEVVVCFTLIPASVVVQVEVCRAGDCCGGLVLGRHCPLGRYRLL